MRYWLRVLPGLLVWLAGTGIATVGYRVELLSWRGCGILSVMFFFLGVLITTAVGDWWTE